MNVRVLKGRGCVGVQGVSVSPRNQLILPRVLRILQEVIHRDCKWATPSVTVKLWEIVNTDAS